MLNKAYQVKALLHMLPFGRNLKGEFLSSTILVVRGESGGCDLYQSKAHQRLPITSKYKGLLYLLPFGRNSNVK